MFWQLAVAVWLLNLNKVTVWRWFSYFFLSTKISTSQLCLRHVNCGLTFLKTTDSSTVEPVCRQPPPPDRTSGPARSRVYSRPNAAAKRVQRAMEHLMNFFEKSIIAATLSPSLALVKGVGHWRVYGERGFADRRIFHARHFANVLCINWFRVCQRRCWFGQGCLC
jgi:hypothetical protein